MKLQFINDYPLDLHRFNAMFRRIAKKTVTTLAIDDNYVVEVNFVDNPTIQMINRDYRNKDSATDVISFAFLDHVDGEVIINDPMPFRLLGTIIISVDKAQEQAEYYQHSFEREMKFLFIHGLLHLLGYDHQDSEHEQSMFSLQDKIIGKRKKVTL